MQRWYLISYGLMGQIGRFAADAGARYERGQAVVIRSHRGIELGEILIENPARESTDIPPAVTACILRAAGPADLERARLAERERAERFAVCQAVFRDGLWPIDLIDVEPLLDDRRTVLHYLGPHRLDVTGVLAAFRDVCDLDVMLQPVGRDVPEIDPLEDAEADDHAHACGTCSSENGGCGSSSGGCGSSAGGCSDCGVKKLMTARQ